MLQGSGSGGAGLCRWLIGVVLLGFTPVGRPDVAGEAWWADWDVSGYVEAETRLFPESPAERAQFDHADASLALEPELFRRWDESRITFRMKPFMRLDLEDDARTHADLRELIFVKSADQWDLRVGVGKVFWGVTESQHLVDVINQTDLVENVDGEDKLGQPMLNLDWITDNAGTFGVYYLPYFRERTFPGIEGRLRPIPAVDTDHPIYESSLGEWHPGAALRWFTTMDEFDVGFHYFYGTSRDPLFSPNIGPDGSVVLFPVYNLMHQVGLDLQWTHGSWLWKLEALAREGRGQHYQAWVGGFEYTFYGVLGTASDLGVLSEYHYDSRGADALNLLNNDLFVGIRWASNDAQDTALLAGGFYDHETGSSAARLELERRIGSHYTLELEGQWLMQADASDPVHALQRDSYLQITLKRFF